MTNRDSWGKDPNKWVIHKSSFGSWWCLFPPNDNDMIRATTFDEARETFKALTRTLPKRTVC